MQSAFSEPSPQRAKRPMVGLGEDRRHVQGESPPSGDGGESYMESLSNGPFFVLLRQIITNWFPWLGSTESLKNSLHLVLASIKERPATSILYGLVLVFGFIPFAGFVLLVCGSFAIFFTWFIFCQFIAVVISALLCTGLFWAMLGAFVVLATLMGGAVHTLMFWGVLARHARRLVTRLTIFMLRQVGVPESDLPPSRPD